MIRQLLNWRIGLALIAVAIVIGTVFYSNFLAKKIANEEREKLSQWIEANKFIANAPDNIVTPVAFPPGRFKLATKPSRTGSSPVMKVIGIELVAAFAAATEGLFAKITVTRRLKSAASDGRRSLRLSAQRYSIATFVPST